MKGTELEETGIELYGAYWPSIMAKWLHKSRRTIFNKKNAEEIGEGLQQQIVRLIDDKITRLKELRARYAPTHDGQVARESAKIASPLP